MHARSLQFACVAALLFCGSAAQALTCDIVLDRNNNVIYQDTTPPVDLSDRGAAAREKMRQRGELLMIIETDQCPRLVFSSATGAASVDAIVAEMRPYIDVTGAMGSSARAGGGIPASTPSSSSPASSAPPARSSPPGRY